MALKVDTPKQFQLGNLSLCNFQPLMAKLICTFLQPFTMNNLTLYSLTFEVVRLNSQTNKIMDDNYVLSDETKDLEATSQREASKGQLISKRPFVVFAFFQKTNENKSTSSKVEFVRSFFGRNVDLKKSFQICLTFSRIKSRLNPIKLQCHRVNVQYVDQGIQVTFRHQGIKVL